MDLSQNDQHIELDKYSFMVYDMKILYIPTVD